MKITPDTAVYTAVERGNPTDLIDGALGDQTAEEYAKIAAGRTYDECLQDMSEWLQVSMWPESGWYLSAAKAAEYLEQHHPEISHRYEIVATTARELHELIMAAAAQRD
jgi:hypothetical protein